MRLAFALVPLAACFEPPTVSLADRELHTRVIANPGTDYAWDVSISFETDYDPRSTCDHVHDDITAVLDGEPMAVAYREGERFIAGVAPPGNCLPIGFAHLPGPAVRSTRPALSTITVVDEDRSFTVQVEGLRTHDLIATSPIARGSTVSFAWPSAGSDEIGVDARVEPYVATGKVFDDRHWVSDPDYRVDTRVTVTGNQFDIAIGALDTVPTAAELDVTVGRTPEAARCDSPMSCEVWVYDALATPI